MQAENLKIDTLHRITAVGTAPALWQQGGLQITQNFVFYQMGHHHALTTQEGPLDPAIVIPGMRQTLVVGPERKVWPACGVVAEVDIVEAHQVADNIQRAIGAVNIGAVSKRFGYTKGMKRITGHHRATHEFVGGDVGVGINGAANRCVNTSFKLIPISRNIQLSLREICTVFRGYKAKPVFTVPVPGVQQINKIDAPAIPVMP